MCYVADTRSITRCDTCCVADTGCYKGVTHVVLLTLYTLSTSNFYHYCRFSDFLCIILDESAVFPCLSRICFSVASVPFFRFSVCM
jgi:hypothetical protein